MPEERLGRPLYHPKNSIEGRGIRVVRIGHVLQRRELGVELEEQSHLVLIARRGRLIAEDPSLPAVERHDQVELGKVLRVELAGAMVRPVVPGDERRIHRCGPRATPPQWDP